MTELAESFCTATSFAAQCLSLDLEVSPKDARIRMFAAVSGQDGRVLQFQGGDLKEALGQLEGFANGHRLLLGHNLIAFDAPHLAAINPELGLLALPKLDTLRLNPLAFPQNPYHHLVKHYQEGQLKRGRINDPAQDARMALQVLVDQFSVLQELNTCAPDRLLAWHWLTSRDEADSGFDDFFSAIRGCSRPSDSEAGAAIARELAGKTCQNFAQTILESVSASGWPLAYALAWLSVAEGNSVMPPWVRHQFPEAFSLINRLRDRACNVSTCAWCRERHDPRQELRRWFGFDDFRPKPADESGRPLQAAIVEAAMRGEHVLGILPTGTGKSLCYQIPALSRFDKTGALTVVISPLVALMSDQVANLQARGIQTCAAINGMLSMPERAEVLDRVRLGDIGILIISPEQLRNRSVRKILAQREIGAWVLDEAHCLSKWGHAFRPDYRYVARFIKERATGASIPPILCLTATAKPDVLVDIISHFKEKLDIELNVVNGGSKRENLEFAFLATTETEKRPEIVRVLSEWLPADTLGGAIVYCATRRMTEEVAAYLRERGIEAAHFHGALKPETKGEVQDRFVRGELRVIAATNAFGMGIDKQDVRLVIHADIPGSLENYLQEAGRAGRDQELARCVLLYTSQDVERQFGMSARSRLSQREIQAILNALKKLDRKKRLQGTVIATAGEILYEENGDTFQRDVSTDDTRVRTAVSWLEEADLLKREENVVNVFPSSLRVRSLEEARAKLIGTANERYQKQLLTFVEAMMDANPDEGISTDELMGVCGFKPDEIRQAFHDLERVGIASNDTALTAFVHAAVEDSSLNRLAKMEALESALIEEMRRLAVETGDDARSILRIRAAAQHLRDAGHTVARPDVIWRIVQGIEKDGRRDEDETRGSWRVKRLDGETAEIKLARTWSAIEQTTKLRRLGARRLLEHLIASLPVGARGKDLLAETTQGKLLAALEADASLVAQVRDLGKLLDRTLIWLHEQEIIRLHQGLAIFRQAMTIQLSPERRGFLKADFAPLQMHYEEQIAQIHVMAEYVQRGLQHVADAVRLSVDYFALGREEFLARWLPERKPEELYRQTTPESWQAIVGGLNPEQRRIATDDREQTNVLVLAGPGSGKTRVLVHRIAYLLRARREDPQGILALAYNRHAATEIRRRLSALVGNDAHGVTVMTCHALAMRLAGVSFDSVATRTDQDVFRDALRQAIALLKGEGLPPDEADEQRERLLKGFRWILVDEYQDIEPDQYELISALAGRTRQDEEGRLSLFAVGDDDQNIYAFNGASVEFIRRFEADYNAKPSYLVENYRSTAHIIQTANMVVEPARHRMKAEHPITIDRGRRKEPAGGEWQTLDPVARGRVQILDVEPDEISQAFAAMRELERLASLSPDWDWRRCAILAREWKYLEPVRAYCEHFGIPAQLADEEPPKFWTLRETQALVALLGPDRLAPVRLPGIQEWLDEQAGPWWDLLREAIVAYRLDFPREDLPVGHLLDWLAEWGREFRRRPAGLTLSTAHRAKGLEFHHVVVLDGGWDRRGGNEDGDAPRRLFYVAMTRARQTLTLMRSTQGHGLLDSLADAECILRRAPLGRPPGIPELRRRYEVPTLAKIDIGFVGRFDPSAQVHKTIARLGPGDSLSLRHEGSDWLLVADDGQIVGRMAKKFQPPVGCDFASGTVRGVVVRRKLDGAPEYSRFAKCDLWETILPQFVFSPRR